jgi:hypothetical protein
LVRVSRGLVKISDVSPNSTIWPRWKKAVFWLTARGLLHVVRDDHDRVAAAQLVDQLLDLGGRDRIERGGGSSIRMTSGSTAIARRCRAAAAGRRERGAAFGQPVLDLVPEPGAAERLLDDRVEIGRAGGKPWMRGP